MYPRPPGWALAPHLLVDEQFSRLVRPSIAPTGGTSLFGDYGFPWAVQAVTTAGTVQQVTGITYRIGVVQISTAATSGRAVALGMDLSVGDDIGDLSTPTPVVRADRIYRWDWWIEITSVASVSYIIGVADSPLGAANNAVFFMDTNTDGNWYRSTTAASTSTTTSTGIAAVIGWQKFSGVYAPAVASGNMAWHFYIDDVLVGINTANLPSAPVVPFVFVRTRTSAAKSITVDRCMLWSDGADILT